MRSWVVAVVLGAWGCGSSDSSVAQGPASDAGSAPPPPPAQSPPTGGRWKGVTVENECGRATIEWVVVDEVCGDTESPRYLDAFEAPMFRDGAIVGDRMYAVDASGLWVLDVSTAGDPARLALLTGFGRPLAAATHAGRVVLAAGDSGLLVLDVSDAVAPSIAAAVPLYGTALDVHVEGDRAYVAAGKAGLHVVDLGSSPPGRVETIAVPGFAAGVETRGDTAYVAACTTLAVVDLPTATVVGTSWLAEAHAGELLVAPAKDVEVVGDVAFVAAGRYGAVAVDVAHRDAPAVLGNCTIDDDLSFHASGVRADSSGLYVAGGEWGILRLETADPRGACASLSSPLVLGPPAAAGDCTTEPPWEVLDWEDRWAPPPPPPPSPPGLPPAGRDPIQVLPHEGLLYAFGDARRLGLRAVDVRDPLDPVLARVGRYDEPWRIEDVAARAGRVLVVGARSVLYDVATDGSLTPVDAALPDAGVAGDLLADGRWVVGRHTGEVLIEGGGAFRSSDPLWPGSIVASGQQILVANPFGYQTLDDRGIPVAAQHHGRTSRLPPALVEHDGVAVMAAPEWATAFDFAEGALQAHGVFDDAAILDVGLWRLGLPRRVLVSAGETLVEVATLGTRAGLFQHRLGASLLLPQGTYAGGAWAGERVHVVANDRSRYRSQLATIVLGNRPVVESTQSFVGVATDVATDGGRLFVGDADGAVRVYSVPESGAESGRPALQHVARLESGS